MQLSAGPNRFFDPAQGEAMWNGLVPGGQSPTAAYNIAFTNGVASAEVEADLNEANVSLTPTITVSPAAGNGFASLSGTYADDQRRRGRSSTTSCCARGSGRRPRPSCYSVYVGNTSANCITIATGATPATTYYAAQEDVGGNFLGNVAADLDAGRRVVGAQWSPTSATHTSTFSPTPGWRRQHHA